MGITTTAKAVLLFPSQRSRVLAKISNPSGSWAWLMGVATSRRPSFEYSGNFRGENVSELVKVEHFAKICEKNFRGRLQYLVGRGPTVFS